jgi:hypothetical protein
LRVPTGRSSWRNNLGYAALSVTGRPYFAVILMPIAVTTTLTTNRDMKA